MGFLAVGIGGGIGAMMSYAISMIPYKHTFPLLTLITNILGAVFNWILYTGKSRKQCLGV